MKLLKRLAVGLGSYFVITGIYHYLKPIASEEQTVPKTEISTNKNGVTNCDTRYTLWAENKTPICLRLLAASTENDVTDYF